MALVYTMFKRIGTLWITIALLLAVIFGIGLVVGWWLPTELKLSLLQGVLSKFADILARSENASSLALNIFLNNLLVAGIVFVAAIIPLLTGIIIFGNGALIGVFADLLWRLDYLQPGTFNSAMISLLPHGIFELSAIFLAGSLGIILFCKLVAPKKLKPELSRGQFTVFTLKWFSYLVIPMLVAAAVVEAFISPRVAEALLPDEMDAATSPYVVKLNAFALAETNCVPDEPSNLASLSTDQLSVLYDDTLAELLKQRAKVGQWQITYNCPEGGWFSISSFDTAGWSADQAKTLVMTMLEHLQANYTEPQPYIINTKLNGVSLRYSVLTSNNQTVVITQTDLAFNPHSLFAEAN